MVPVSYGYRNLLVRWRTTIMTSLGFTLVVAALIIMLAFFNGIRAACIVTGEPQNVLVLNKGNLDEVLSQIDFVSANQIELTAHVLRDADGRPLTSRELFLVVTESDPRNDEPTLLQVRGILPNAWKVHSQAKLISGRMFHPGQGEIIVGKGFQWEWGLKLGDTVRIARKDWRVVGVFEANGSTFESEIWGDLGELAGYFRRKSVYSSIILRTAGAADAQQVVESLKNSRRVSVDAQLETEYYDRQADQLEAIRSGALVVVVFMAIGAVFGVTNTMFAAIGQRIKDIAVMRLMGFRRGEILISFLLETLLIAFIGGGLGTLIGYAFDGVTFSTALGAKSIAFSFRVDGPTLMMATLMTICMGLVGGLLPAFSAMRVRPLESLR
jgi:ABC-type lipoprotein release transport system permease subunit